MKKSNLVIATLLIAPALILAQPAGRKQAGPEGSAGLKTAQWFNHFRSGDTRLMDLLKLTDQQIAEHKKINLKYQRLNIPLHADLRLANLDLREAIESLDQKKIDEAVKKINDLHAKMFANRIDQKIEYLKTLTEEQKKILKDRPARMRMNKRSGGPGIWGDLEDPEAGMDASYGFGWDLPPGLDDFEMEPED